LSTILGTTPRNISTANCYPCGWFHLNLAEYPQLILSGGTPMSTIWISYRGHGPHPEITHPQMDRVVNLITTLTTVKRLWLKMRICQGWFSTVKKIEGLQYISWKVVWWTYDDDWEPAIIPGMLKNLEVNFREGWGTPRPPICSFQIVDD
jgi:hypothetical protein